MWNEMGNSVQKCKFLTNRMFASFDDPTFPSLEHSTTVSASQQTILGLLCVFVVPDNRWHKCHLLSNKTKPREADV